MKYKPTKELLAFIEEHPEHMSALSEALKTSSQWRGGMCNDDDTARCCLCVSARLEGATFDDYNGNVVPNKAYAPISSKLAVMEVAASCKDADRPSRLNDSIMTHAQISELFAGNEVEV